MKLAERVVRHRSGAGMRRFLIAGLGASGLALTLLALVFALSTLLLDGLVNLVNLVLDRSSLLDPVYTRAAVRSLADAQLDGLAVAGAAGAWLHQVRPDIFADPSRAHWLPLRTVLAHGSPLLGRLVAAGLAHASVVGLGLVLMGHGVRDRRPALQVAGLAVQLTVAVSILGYPPTLRELDSTGLAFAANALFPWLVMRDQSLSDAVGGLWPPLLEAVLVGLALAMAYLPVAALLVFRRHTRVLSFGTAFAVVLSSAACAGVLGDTTLQAASPPALTTSVVAAEAPRLAASVSAALQSDAVMDRWYAEAAPAAQTDVATPSQVAIQGGDGHYVYLVNGQPEVIQGMGLNTQYAQQLSPDDRARQLDSDMAALQSIGVNTVLGWDPAEFDEVLLDAAQRHGIGVIMPFELDPDADYTDPAYQRQLRDQVLAWVARYRNHPALRMWGLGNEVLHKIVHPAWVGPQDPGREANAEAFSDWLISTSDAIHAADPNHPVTYREAEDAFVPWLAAALQRAGGQPRPWFALGTNCYQDYLSQIVDTWPNSGMPTALWVSEFAPGTMAMPDRPDGFARMWGFVRAHPEYVLGGAVYAWTRNGPEGVDRTFGLTDDGVAVDGQSLDMLSSLFHPQR